MLRLRQALLIQFKNVQRKTKIQPAENIKLSFDKKVFSSSLDRLESKLERLSQDYRLCLDTAEDLAQDGGIHDLEKEKNKCHKTATLRIDELTRFLEAEGKHKLFCMKNSDLNS